jgi:hypothetical protein
MKAPTGVLRHFQKMGLFVSTSITAFSSFFGFEKAPLLDDSPWAFYPPVLGI